MLCHICFVLLSFIYYALASPTAHGLEQRNDGITFHTNILRGWHTARAIYPEAKLKYVVARPRPERSAYPPGWQVTLEKEQDLVIIHLYFDVNGSVFEIQSNPGKWGTWLELQLSSNTPRLPEHPFDPRRIKISVTRALPLADKFEPWGSIIRVSITTLSPDQTEPGTGSALVYGFQNPYRWQFIDTATGKVVRANEATEKSRGFFPA